MSRIHHLLSVITVLAALAITGAAQEVHTDYDKRASFAAPKTYEWAKVQTTNPLWQDRITSAVDAQLQTKGWRRVPSNSDVALTAIGASQTQEEYQTFYSGLSPRWRWGGFGDYATTTVVTYKVGTLVLDMYDTKTNKLMWRGTAVDTVSSKPEKNEKKLEKGVEKMFEKFPPKEPE
jgi:uncharacterized protein DUF4136